MPFACLIFLLFTTSLSASAPVWVESLESALAKAKTNSPTLQSAQANVEAARLGKNAFLMKLLPALSLEGNYFYQTTLPTVTLPGMGGASFTAGSHNNYTVGPVLRYTAFDGIQSIRSYQSSQALIQSKQESLKSATRELTLLVKQAYFKAQLAAGNLLATSDALKLAMAQAHDIDLRFEAGASSKLDQFSSNREVTQYRIKFEQAQGELGNSIRDILVLTGEEAKWDLSTPAPIELQNNLPKTITPPSAYLKFDIATDTLAQLSSAFQNPEPNPGQPQVKALSFSAQAAELSAKAQEGSLWPRIDLSAKTQFLYPNMIALTQTWNNIFALNLTFPLWLGDASWSSSRQKFQEAHSIRFQQEQKLRDLRRDYLKSKDMIQNLRLQQISHERLVNETEQIAKLMYQAYKTGKLNFLEVQAANFNLLEARLSEARTQQQLLMQLATLEYLSGEDHE